VLTLRSVNTKKTGKMGQAWIIPVRIDPAKPPRTWAHWVGCQDCALLRWCYVQWPQAPSHVWQKYRRGEYPPVEWGALSETLVRIGASGDPGVIPIDVWEELVRRCKGYVGYTHMWRRASSQPLRQYLRASVESEAGQRAAAAMGWRTFRVKAPDMPRLAGEMTCPASVVGHSVTCDKCLTCRGVGPNVVIDAHGRRASQLAAWLRAQAHRRAP
jgi:hypothetical protein